MPQAVFPDEAYSEGFIMLPSVHRMSPMLTACPKPIIEDRTAAIISSTFFIVIMVCVLYWRKGRKVFLTGEVK